VSAGVILLLGLFWTWFGITCEWPDPVGMFMHTLIPGLPLVGLGLICWRLPVLGGLVLTLWGASPLLALIGGRPFFNYSGHWLTLTPVLVYWLPLLLGIVLFVAGVIRERELDRCEQQPPAEGG
jgi:hypothetical protein